MSRKIEDAFPKVQRAVAQACGLDEDAVTMGSRLVGDLGMESLDFIDMIYELEQAFGITIAIGSLDAEIEAAMGDEPFEVDGIVTPAGIQHLRASVPGLDESAITDDFHSADIPFLLTVESVCGLIVRTPKSAESGGPG